jgi:hypothetical protein
MAQEIQLEPDHRRGRPAVLESRGGRLDHRSAPQVGLHASVWHLPLTRASCGSFARSKSPGRAEHAHQPLVSCLVNGQTSTTPKRPVRRPSLPLPLRPDAVTVPLRACCGECYPITEECLKEGAHWEEKFTRAARRRRNSSADAHAHAHAARHRRVCDDIPGFGAMVSVDEIDRRHGTSSVAPAASPVSPSPAASYSTDSTEIEAGLAPSFSRKVSLGADPPPIVQEEADDDLFPLPSPRAFSSALQHAAEPDPFALPQGSATSGSHGDDDDTVFFTPDISPAIAAWEQGSHSSTSSPSESLGPTTPLQAYTRGMAVPASPHHQPEALFADETDNTDKDNDFAFADALPESPALPSTPSTPGAGRKRSFMNLPGRGSFMRAGADLWKGVTAIGSSPLPISI